MPKIIITESQLKSLMLFEQNDMQSRIESTKKDLKSRGWSDDVIGGGESDAEVIARSVLLAMRKLNELISSKVISGSKGKYGVCVTKLQKFSPAACSYYSATDFDDLAKNISGKMIGKNRASDVVYNDTINFKFGEIQQNVLNQFKYNENAGNSDLFPNGWWNYFVTYFGTDNYTEIKNRINSIAHYDVGKNKDTLNVYTKGGQSIFASIGECLGDYHCVLDVASIVSLAIPGVGPIVSMGLDVINASTYGVEAATAQTPEERDAALIAGGLTLFGGFIGGGVKQTKNIVTKASRKPEIYKYVDDYVKTVNKELPALKNLKEASKNAKVDEIMQNTAKKHGLTQSDVLVAHDIINTWSKIKPEIVTKYTEALKTIESKIDKANLIRLSSDSGFQKLLLQNEGDIIKTLNKYAKTSAGEEALKELGLFVTLTEVLSDPSVQEWIGNAATYIKYCGGNSIKSKVNCELGEGAWEKVRDEIFMSDKSGEENGLISKAWREGWRPGKDIPEKYWTKAMKQKYEKEFTKQAEKISAEFSQEDLLKSEKVQEIIKQKEKETIDYFDNLKNSIGDDENKIDSHVDNLVDELFNF